MRKKKNPTAIKNVKCLNVPKESLFQVQSIFILVWLLIAHSKNDEIVVLICSLSVVYFAMF